MLVGVRFQLALAEYQTGLFKMSSRGKMWLAPRAGVSTQAVGAVWGGDLGVAFRTHGMEVGGWMGFYTWRGPMTGDMTTFTEIGNDGAVRVLQFQAGMTFSSSDL